MKRYASKLYTASSALKDHVETNYKVFKKTDEGIARA
jgi:hypothetical protein